MTSDLNLKVASLRRRLHSLESAVVAFSGGVDSSILVFFAHKELAENMLAVTALSPSMPRQDAKVAENFCSKHKIPHRFIETREFDDPQFISNPDNRCYYCKKHIYLSTTKIADELNFKFIVEGTNLSDLKGHRPGFGASKENPRVITPLIDEKFTKEDVRNAAGLFGLEVAHKPQAACLSSRVPTGVALSKNLLENIDEAEDFLRSFDIAQVRVRHHGDLARIEVEEKDFAQCLKYNKEIAAKLNELGWKFTTLDILGYRTGGMRE